ncbi:MULTISPECIES: monofunctional biosynthetic peptidoglycan transglycosylase [unclassified Methylophaga]|jgi:monofunctional biosynthetic peptidoglycan transglycosylase|uniref:monofunctional biosynthetic peptidoglycan transglycosylase n=1 Tax=unclassified Methylophaga TaxID=2629249 RepID=UPI00259C6ED6|nr:MULTISPECIES: monofunctional biosynthetic peptidoglycan transglycosylase [unclassified Methylophaga]|tara:strand:- start:156 stop:854 length:699 start_codon:yes stop_codon:yes gene_type:complete
MLNKIKRIFIKWLLYAMLGWLVLSLLIVLPFRWLNPPVSMVMLERWLTHDDYSIQQTWLSWDEMLKKAALAVITSEDQRFPIHQGFDVDAIMKALNEAEEGGRLRGASTISQQVAKNMFLWTGRSWLRKGLEVWFTSLIEVTWGKQRILEVYMNIAEWGPGVFGIEAASQYHFGKRASQLTDMQAALLASTLPSPLKYDPARPAQHLIDRARWNLAQQRKLGGTNWLAPISE